MKNILFLPCCATVVFLIYSCTKTSYDIQNQENENQKLSEIIGDSMDVPTGFAVFEYTGNNISKATYWNINLGDTSIANFEYEDNGSHIKGTDNTDPEFYHEWFLNDLKLPIKVIQHTKAYNGNNSLEYDFFYNPQSNHLDSITIPSSDGSSSLIYLFQYTEDNITAVIEPWKSENRIDTFLFTYDANPNAFRNANPIFYVYDLPLYSELYFDPLQIVEMFSKNMFSTYSYRSYNQIKKYTLQYSIINDNQLKDWRLIDDRDSYVDWKIHYNYK